MLLCIRLFVNGGGRVERGGCWTGSADFSVALGDEEGWITASGSPVLSHTLQLHTLPSRRFFRWSMDGPKCVTTYECVALNVFTLPSVLAPRP